MADSITRFPPPGARALPHNLEAEQAFLGSLLVGTDFGPDRQRELWARVAGLIGAHDFYEPVHQRIFAAIARELEAGRLVSAVTLRREFDQDQDLRELDGARYLANLARAAETILNIEDYARLIHDLAVRRGLIAIGEDLVTRAYDPQSHETGADQIGAALSRLDLLGEVAVAGEDAIATLDPIAALEAPRPQREWLVPDYVPARCCTLLAGDGGTGKTLLVQQLAVCMAASKSWLGASVKPGRVALLACEDKDDELTLRLHDICAGLSLSHEDLGDRLHIASRVGKENRLTKFAMGEGMLTPFWHMLVRWLEAVRPQLLIIDHAAQVYTGNENDRPSVTWFCNRLESLCLRLDLSIILLCHISKAAGSTYSGSTAWSGSVRSRLLLARDESEPGLRKLIRPKANYADEDQDGVPLRWASGMLKPEREDLMTYADRLNLEMERGRHRQTFLDALDQLTKQCVSLSHTPGRGFAPKLIEDYGLAQNCSRRDLEIAMRSLIAEGAIKPSQALGWDISQGRKATGLARI